MSLILVPSTVTEPCGDGETQTVTDFREVSTVVVETTVTRTSTEGQVTSYVETTETTQAACHYPTSMLSPGCERRCRARSRRGGVRSSWTNAGSGDIADLRVGWIIGYPGYKG